MGDRANIVIRKNWPEDVHFKEAIFLYSHWGAPELPETLRLALEFGRTRWADASYLARIVFDRMIGDGQYEETGFGISTRLTDNSYDLIVLSDLRVYLLPERDYREQGFLALASAPWCSFEAVADFPAELGWQSLRDLMSDTPTMKEDV